MTRYFLLKSIHKIELFALQTCEKSICKDQSKQMQIRLNLSCIMDLSIVLMYFYT